MDDPAIDKLDAELEAWMARNLPAEPIWRDRPFSLAVVLLAAAVGMIVWVMS